MSTWLIPGVDAETKLFPQPTMDALADALGATPDEIQAAVEEYLTANPPAAGEPLLAAHVADPEPHPAYDDTPSLSTLFENGLV